MYDLEVAQLELENKIEREVIISDHAKQLAIIPSLHPHTFFLGAKCSQGIIPKQFVTP